ncbi:hypothetical protein [Microbacterium sp. NIBRBAC000506063]|uniref:hypothetical protein n=1 Tax=Microbacterium sp. NIBRBAC000506063 TaxID=2734618 RepID=UPI001BB616B0|nr:hypothetical protein [Microbacterium sp. NIBRBAC000506063]QTV80183.1 hypothetical protein KAE78_03850 [Microbacterium sp. NIBRBAC000506063]
MTIVAIGVAIGIIASGGAEEPSQAATVTEDTQNTGERDKTVSKEPLVATETTTAPLSDDERSEVARAEAAVEAVVAVTNEIGARGDGSTVGLPAIATGWALGELEARAREQLDLGYRQVGEAVITRIEASAVELDASPATMTLTVCIDVSGIDVLDAGGNSLKSSLYNPGHPITHVYGAVFEENTWKISTHDIPDSEECADS